MIEKKYEITEEELFLENGARLHRIKALRDIHLAETKISDGEWIHAGDLGGWIQEESNLSQEGECWIKGNGIVFGNAVIQDNGIVTGNAVVCGNSKLCDNSVVCRDAIVIDSTVFESAIVSGAARVHSNYVCGGKVYGGFTFEETPKFWKEIEYMLGGAFYPTEAKYFKTLKREEQDEVLEERHKKWLSIFE